MVAQEGITLKLSDSALALPDDPGSQDRALSAHPRTYIEKTFSAYSKKSIHQQQRNSMETIHSFLPSWP